MKTFIVFIFICNILLADFSIYKPKFITNDLNKYLPIISYDEIDTSHLNIEIISDDSEIIFKYCSFISRYILICQELFIEEYQMKDEIFITLKFIF